MGCEDPMDGATKKAILWALTGCVSEQSVALFSIEDRSDVLLRNVEFPPNYAVPQRDIDHF
jgi:hypothetical protein